MWTQNFILRPFSCLLFIALGCQNAPSPKKAPVADQQSQIRLILTTDEHGWLEPGRGKGGTKIGGSVSLAAHLSEERAAAISNQKKILLFSIGDMWTGPYLSTLLKGEPMVATMNSLGYDGVVIGNHDFDFGQEQLSKNVKDSNFPYLAANVKQTSSQQSPQWAMPYKIYEAQGVKIGVMGLSNELTPETTDKKNLADLEFDTYVNAINYWVPQIRADGADEIVVLVHDHPAEKLNDVVFALVRNNVRVLGLGHAHRSHHEIFDPGTPNNANDDVIICNAGAYLRKYCRIDLVYKNKNLLHHAVEVVQLSVSPAQKTKQSHIQKIIDDAHHQVDDYAQTYLTRIDSDMKRNKDELGQFVVSSWLNFFPKVDVSITNRGAIRQDLHKGEVRIRDVISVLPFENSLIIVTITGKQLKEVLLKKESIAAGVMFQIEQDSDGNKRINQILDKLGNPIGDEQKVNLVINEFMYRGGDGYPFYEMDTNPELTAVNWRTPVIEALQSLK